MCFNPHPAFWPGASLLELLQHWRVLVSILTRPSGRVQAGGGSPCDQLRRVSILTPAFWPGARTSGIGRFSLRDRFQSSPGLLAGCKVLGTGKNLPSVGVSILTRPSGRVQAPSGLWSGARAGPFQSSPGLLAGCKRAASRSSLSFARFQSSPGLLAGCKGRPRCSGSTVHRVSILTRPSGRVQA